MLRIPCFLLHHEDTIDYGMIRTKFQFPFRSHRDLPERIPTVEMQPLDFEKISQRGPLGNALKTLPAKHPAFYS